MNTFYLTTAIDYPNGPPHIGHAYEKVLTDVIARYHRQKGERVYFLTGVDQHGQKIVQTADKEGVNPATLAKRNTKKFLRLLERLQISNDGWVETTDARHIACVQKVLTSLYDKGCFYKKVYKGFYSLRQEQFLTEKERGEDGNFSSDYGEVIELEEENWYFKLSEHTDWLRGVIESGKLRIFPEFRKREVLNAIKRSEGTDLCISRPKKRLSWGIEIPFDPDFVTYVWFDALLNYLSFSGYLKEDGVDLPDFSRLWPAHWHVIGKDILVPPHAIYWPCMLHAMGFADEELPGLMVHGWWNTKGEKMSKSLGNIIAPMEVEEKFGVDALRYYLVRDIATGKDSDFDLDRLVTIYNAELANDMGNLLNRTLNMVKRYQGGVLTGSDYEDEENQKLRDSQAKATQTYMEAMDGCLPSEALKAVNAHISYCNAYVDRCQPWQLAKDEAQAERLASVLYHLAESCTQAAILLETIIPQASSKMRAQLGFLEKINFPDLKWGLLEAGHKLGRPKPVFPRILQKEEP